MTEPTLEKPVTQPAEYVKKPIVIKAMQWDGTAEGAEPILAWIALNGGTAVVHGTAIRLVTTHGDYAYLRDGDWCVPDRNPGTFYPIADEVFGDTYEPLHATQESS